MRVANSEGVDIPVAKFGYGRSFGELALRFRCARSATIVALDEVVELFALDRLSFEKAAGVTSAAPEQEEESYSVLQDYTVDSTVVRRASYFMILFVFLLIK